MHYITGVSIAEGKYNSVSNAWQNSEPIKDRLVNCLKQYVSTFLNPTAYVSSTVLIMSFVFLYKVIKRKTRNLLCFNNYFLLHIVAICDEWYEIAKSISSSPYDICFLAIIYFCVLLKCQY